MNTPRVSVILPCWQCVDTVEETVQSVCAQRMPDWELIAVDDGATDGTGALLDTWAQRDARIRVLHTANGGVARARTAGIQAARGTWVTFVDADDLLPPDALGTLLALEDAQTDLLCGAYVQRFEDEGGRERRFACPQEDRLALLARLVRSDGMLNPMYAHLYRTQMLHEHGIVPPAGVRVGEDVLFNLECMMAARAWRMTPEVVYLYRYGGDSAMTRAHGHAWESSQPMREGIAAFLARNELQTPLFRAQVDFYLRTLRKDRGKLGAALAFDRRVGAALTRGVDMRALGVKDRLIYIALRTLPCLCIFLS